MPSSRSRSFTPPPNSTEALYGNALTRVLTPKVAAHPDGVHYQIDNRLGNGIQYEINPETIETTSGRIPEGLSKHVYTLPPGTAKIRCIPRNWATLPTQTQPTYAHFEIVVGKSGYKSLEPECKPGAEPRFSTFVASGAGSKFELVSYRDPVERAREYFSKELKEGDVVEEAGYPEDPDPPVRVVRNGKVVATIDFY